MAAAGHGYLASPQFTFPAAGPASAQQEQAVETVGKLPCIFNATCRCCGGGADFDSFGIHTKQGATQGYIPRAVANTGATITGDCCCLGLTDLNDVWFETDAGGEVETRQEVFNIRLDVSAVHPIFPTTKIPHMPDVHAMHTELKQLAAEGWQLGTIYNSPVQIAGCCACSGYKGAYVCMLSRKPGDVAPRKLLMVDVTCGGTEFNVKSSNRKHSSYIMDRRKMQTADLEKCVHQFYLRGARLAAALQAGSWKPLHTGAVSREATPCERTFFLFFEEFEDSARNKPHAAVMVQASKMVKHESGCCSAVPNERWDTSALTQTWRTAAERGWKIADVFDNGDEQGFHRDSLMIFEAPLAAGAQEGLINMGQVSGASGTHDQPPGVASATIPVYEVASSRSEVHELSL